MQVRLIHIDQATGAETAGATCDLRECCPEDEDFFFAQSALVDHGFTFLGGGAMPLVRLIRVVDYLGSA